MEKREVDVKEEPGRREKEISRNRRQPNEVPRAGKQKAPPVAGPSVQRTTSF